MSQAPIHHESYDQAGVIVAGQPIPNIARAVWVGGAGTVMLVPKGTQGVVPFVAVAGTVIPVAPERVEVTGTTATSLNWLA